MSRRFPLLRPGAGKTSACTSRRGNKGRQVLRLAFNHTHTFCWAMPRGISNNGRKGNQTSSSCSHDGLIPHKKTGENSTQLRRGRRSSVGMLQTGRQPQSPCVCLLALRVLARQIIHQTRHLANISSKEIPNGVFLCISSFFLPLPPLPVLFPLLGPRSVSLCRLHAVEKREERRTAALSAAFRCLVYMSTSYTRTLLNTRHHTRKANSSAFGPSPEGQPDQTWPFRKKPRRFCPSPLRATGTVVAAR